MRHTKSAELLVLATSDVHGYILPTDYHEKNNYLGIGLAKAASVIEAVRTFHNNVIYIDNGDFFQGSALGQFMALNKQQDGPSSMIASLNEMGCSALTLGNHEFNYGYEYLKKASDMANFPFLAANIIDYNQDSFIKTHVILDCIGVKIAILGLITNFVPQWENPAHIQHLTFLDPVECAKKWIPILRSKADVVIVSYHGGLKYHASGEKLTLDDNDNVGERLIREVKGIDALILGHQHREMVGSIDQVPYLMPGWRASHVGSLKINLTKQNDKWIIKDKEAMLLKTSRVKVHYQIAQKVRFDDTQVQHWLDQTIGTVKGNMMITDPLVSRSYQHPYVAFVNELQKKIAEVDISCACIFSGRPCGFPKEITVRDIVNNYIYANSLAVLNISGLQLRLALERCAAFFYLNSSKRLSVSEKFRQPFVQYYNYDIYDGIDYAFKLNNPVGQRVVSLTYQDKEIKAEDRLKVVMNNYRAVGGGGYSMFSTNDIMLDIQIDMVDAMIKHISEESVIVAKEKKNFKIIDYYID